MRSSPQIGTNDESSLQVGHEHVVVPSVLLMHLLKNTQFLSSHGSIGKNDKANKHSIAMQTIDPLQQKIVTARSTRCFKTS